MFQPYKASLGKTHDVLREIARLTAAAPDAIVRFDQLRAALRQGQGMTNGVLVSVLATLIDGGFIESKKRMIGPSDGIRRSKPLSHYRMLPRGFEELQQQDAALSTAVERPSST
jgi:hypothetical protein